MQLVLSVRNLEPSGLSGHKHTPCAGISGPSVLVATMVPRPSPHLSALPCKLAGKNTETSQFANKGQEVALTCSYITRTIISMNPNYFQHDKVLRMSFVRLLNNDQGYIYSILEWPITEYHFSETDCKLGFIKIKMKI